MTDWSYDPVRHTYVNVRTGKALTQTQLVAIRDRFILTRQDVARAAVKRYISGELTLAEWSAAFRSITAETFTALFMFGAGGVENMTKLSRSGELLQMLLDRQMPFATGFVKEITSGLVSDAEMEVRATLYQGAAVEAYEQANASDWQIDLPYYPAEGTDCQSNCRCNWAIETVFEDKDEVTYATWQTESDDRVCDTCEQRGGEWQHREIKREPRTDIRPLDGLQPEVAA